MKTDRAKKQLRWRPQAHGAEATLKEIGRALRGRRAVQLRVVLLGRLARVQQGEPSPIAPSTSAGMPVLGHAHLRQARGQAQPLHELADVGRERVADVARSADVEEPSRCRGSGRRCRSPPAALKRITCGRLIALATPWGTPNCAPHGCDIECASRARCVIASDAPRSACCRARPRRPGVAAPRARGCRGSCAAPRASARPGAGSSPATRSPRSRASWRPCRSPRRSPRGSVRVDSGSRIASRGNSGKSAISSLTFSSWSLITAAIETSEPVPGGGGDAGQRRDGQRRAQAVVLARASA